MLSRVSGLVCVAAVGLAGGCLAADARAVETVISDAFADGSAAAAPGSFEADWALSTGGAADPVVDSDDNHLELPLPFSTWAIGTASQDRSATLGVGDSITLSALLDASAFSTGAKQANEALRIGLFNSNGTAATTDDQGYEVLIGIGSGKSGRVRARLGARGDQTFINGDLAVDSDLTLGTTGVLQISFSIELLSSTEVGMTFMVGNSVLFTDSFDHSSLFSEPSPFTDPFVTFDQIVFADAGNLSSSGTLIVDNLELTYIPEPAALTLVGLGTLLMVSRRRR